MSDGLITVDHARGGQESFAVGEVLELRTTWDGRCTVTLQDRTVPTTETTDVLMRIVLGHLGVRVQ